MAGRTRGAAARTAWLGMAAFALIALPQGAVASDRSPAKVQPAAKTPAKTGGKAVAKTAAKPATKPGSKSAPKPPAKSAARPAAASAAKGAKAAAPVRGGSLFAVVIGPGPAWKRGQPLQAAAPDGHFGYWQKLHREGRIENAGPVGKDTGFVLLRARSQAEANALIAADPAVKAGRFRAVARPYTATLTLAGKN